MAQVTGGHIVRMKGGTSKRQGFIVGMTAGTSTRGGGTARRVVKRKYKWHRLERGWWHRSVGGSASKVK